MKPLMKASIRLCICDQCKLNVGLCSLYHEYDLIFEDINQAQLRSSVLPPVDDEVKECRVNDFITPESIVAVAADGDDDTDTIWFISVTKTKCVGDGVKDGYENIIPLGLEYMKGHFLNRNYTTKSSTVFSLSNKVTRFYKETVIFPFVNVKESKKGIEIENKEWTDIICHPEQTGYAHL